MMLRGELVHIPQGALLLKNKNSTIAEGEYLKADKPMRALFWEKDPNEPNWGSIYYRESVWDVRMKDIYPITQEMENAS